MTDQLGAVLTLVVVAVPLLAQTTKVFTWPDGVLQAVALDSPKGESKVQILGPSQSVLLSRDETSADGSHGCGIVHAAWTADSQFFVASEQSSGGHQPWAHPVWVYSRAKNRVFELEKLGATATADFKLKPPDVIETEALVCALGKGDPVNGPFVVNLHQLELTGRLPVVPCPSR